MNVNIEPSWKNALQEHLDTSSFKEIADFVKHRYQETIVYPEPENIFNALNTTPFNKVKVIILGQDPYHNPGQAHGLCFSVQEGVTPPPSLKNIYKEILSDTGIEKDMTDGNLTSWAQQGVLLLNSVLTVEKNKPASHAKRGWENFTDAVIKKVSEEREHCVFLLWGNYAKKKGSIIDRAKHLILESPHPSPFSAHSGFFGNKHFSQTNDYLQAHGMTTIDW